jgi:hypothetical protein
MQRPPPAVHIVWIFNAISSPRAAFLRVITTTLGPCPTTCLDTPYVRGVGWGASSREALSQQHAWEPVRPHGEAQLHVVTPASYRSRPRVRIEHPHLHGPYVLRTSTHAGGGHATRGPEPARQARMGGGAATGGGAMRRPSSTGPHPLPSGLSCTDQGRVCLEFLCSHGTSTTASHAKLVYVPRCVPPRGPELARRPVLGGGVATGGGGGGASRHSLGRIVSLQLLIPGAQGRECVEWSASLRASASCGVHHVLRENITTPPAGSVGQQARVTCVCMADVSLCAVPCCLLTHVLGLRHSPAALNQHGRLTWEVAWPQGAPRGALP